MALFGMGNFSVKAKFNHLKIDRLKWCRMSVNQKKQFFKSFMDQHQDKAPPTSLIQSVNAKRKPSVGRKPNERARHIKSRSHSNLFCSNYDLHASCAYFVRLVDNPRVKKCYKCRTCFDGVNVVGCTQTYRRYFDKNEQKMVISKNPQNVYVHLKCLSHQDFKKK